jgi:arabinose-5-phosphate isomerase
VNVRKIARDVIRIERDTLTRLASRIDGAFERACSLILRSRGRVVVTGMGKPGFIAQKVSATLSSTGTPSLFLHPAEALHGDLGRVVREDVILAFSSSGRTEEILKLLPIVKKIGAKLISFTGDARSPLARASHVVLDVSVSKEACPLNLAPTASTTAMLAAGDALALALLEKNFYHPGGSLGKRLHVKVSEIMRKGKGNPVVRGSLRVRDVLYRITGARAGSATVVDARGRVTGIFTDGDLRRHLRSGEKILGYRVDRVMTAKPITVREDQLASEAFEVLRARRIDEVPVLDKKKRPVGLLDVQDLLKAGFV